MEYGYPAYFGKSSLYSLAYARKVKELESGNTLNSDFEEEKKASDVNTGGVEKTSAAKSVYPLLTPCSNNLHYIHKECMEIVRSQPDMGPDKGFMHGHNMEYSCTICKGLCNVFLIERPIDVQTNTNDGIEVEYNSADDLLERIRGLEAIKKQEVKSVDPFFNDIILLEALTELINNKVLKSRTGEDAVLTFSDDLLSTNCYTVSFEGLENFIKNKHRMLKSMRFAYEEFYKSHESKTKQNYFEKKRGQVADHIAYLYGKRSNNSEAMEEDFEDVNDLEHQDFPFSALQHLMSFK